MAEFNVGPGASINKALNAAKPGDTVRVLAGVYHEVIAPGTGLTVIGAVGAVIDGVWVSNVDNVTLRGFTIKGKLPTVLQVVDDPSVLINPKEAWVVRLPKIQRRFVRYMEAVGTPYTQGASFRNCKGCRIEDCQVLGFMVGIDASRGEVVVARNTVLNCGYGIWASGGDTLGNTCSQNLFSGISVKLAGTHVAENKCDRNGLHGIAVSGIAAANCLVEKNTCSFNGFFSETMEYPGSSAFNFFGVGPGNRCVNNIATGQVDLTRNDGNGYINDTSVNGVIFERNIAVGCIRGIALTKSVKNVVVFNTLSKNLDAGVGYMLPDQLVEHNLFYRNGVGINAQGGHDYNVFSLGDAAVAYYGTPGTLAPHESLVDFALDGNFKAGLVGVGARG